MIKNSILILTTCLVNTVFGMVAPPDTTSNIAEKTAAMYLIEEGKSLYVEGRIRDALTKFRDASKKDVLSWKAPFWISRCHYEQHNYGYALTYAKSAVLLNNNEVDKEVYEILAESYHRLGILDSAIINYENGIAKLSKARALELRMPLRLEQAKYAREQMAKNIANARIRLEGNLNSGYHDYSPVVYKGGTAMYFTSRRSNTTGGGQNPSDQQFFEDIYSAKWNAESNEWDSINNRLGRINGNGFESVSYISEDGMLAYITLNNAAIKDAKIATRSSDIAEVKWTSQGQWSTPKLLDKTVNSSFYDGNATVTADGATMYFVSERNANAKMSDIYVTYKQGNKWSKPVALPAEINSKGRETTPFITPDGRYLFFSSNGFTTGMGGYDVYVVERMGSTWGEVKNLGPMINTVNDDFGFKIYDAIGKAYINGMELIGDKASLDIYEFNLTFAELLKGLAE